MGTERDMRNAQIDRVFMNVAREIASLSRAVKAKVGAIIVDEKFNIISCAFNGTPKGFDNVAETVQEDGTLKTKPEVLHAESNAITKLAKSTQSSDGCTMYVTLTPCLQCSKLIAQAGIKRLVYSHEWDDMQGLGLLEKCGVKVDRIKLE